MYAIRPYEFLSEGVGGITRWSTLSRSIEETRLGHRRHCCQKTGNFGWMVTSRIRNDLMRDQRKAKP